MPVKELHQILKVNLGVRPNERVLVFTDKPAPREPMGPGEAERRERLRNIARFAEETARGLAQEVLFLEYPSLMGHGKEPPEALWRLAFGEGAVDSLKKHGLLAKLRRKSASAEEIYEAQRTINRFKRSGVEVVVALSNFSTSHTMFRNLLTGVCQSRYASMPLFDMQMFAGPMRADYREISRLSKAVAAELKKSLAVHITTPAGTDITFSTKGRKAEADTGLLTRPGAFGNLPAGEAYLAPLEGTAKGRLVIEWGPTEKLGTPLTVDVKDGMAEKVTGRDPYARVLRAKFDERRDNRNIAELGVGTNPLAIRPDNILESEKMLGTVHIAFGDNASFGGSIKTPYHQDFVYFKPTVELEMKGGGLALLLEDGKLLV